MPALVSELVNMASDPAVSVSDLLRRALVAARRLDVPELADWITSELNGYAGEVPDYRQIRGHLEAMDPYHGPVPLRLAQESEWLTLRFEHGSIPELEPLSKDSGTLHHHFPAKIEQALMEGMRVPMRPHLMFSTVQIRGIVERVRSRILEWALDLEGRGVFGEGMTFTQQEKQAVQQLHYHFDNVSGSQIQISSNGSTQTQANTTAGIDIDSLWALIDALGIALAGSRVQGDVVDELRAELATLKAQAASPKPKWEIIKATARSIKTVAEGAAGNILGELAKPHMQILLTLAAGAAGG